MRHLGLVSLLLGLTTLAGCALMSQRSFNTKWKNKPAPDFALRELGGEKVRLSDLRGKPVVLAFFHLVLKLR